jgi:hypothetical protein
MKKPSRKSLIKKCDTLCSLIVRNRGKCEICGRKDTLQSHHLFSKKGHPAVRFDLRNLCCLCYCDHLIRIHQLGDPDVIAKLISNRENVYNELRLKAHSTDKLDPEAIYCYLKDEYEREMSKNK